MPHRHLGAALQMGDAPNVGAQDGAGLHLAQVAQLAVAQLRGHGGLQHAVGAG